MVKISIIIPCYNTHTYLDFTLESIKNQTFRDYEIIIVNDGSCNPETISYLTKLPSDIIVINQKNKGLSAARNTGIEKANGYYCLPLDCDDWLAPNFLEKTISLLKESHENTYAYSYMKLEGEENSILTKSYNFFEQLFTNQIPYCILMPKFMWENLGGYDEYMTNGYEDWEFNIRLGINGYFGVVVPSPLFHYRVSSQGMLKSISQSSHFDLWKYIQNKHYSYFEYSKMYELWKFWKNRKSTYPLTILFLWWIFSNNMPNWICNYILKIWLKRRLIKIIKNIY